MSEHRRRLFCEINPAFYEISMKKENCKRHLQNLLSKEKFAKTRQTDRLPNVVSSHSSYLIKKGKDIDPVLQENKAVNIDLACRKINGIVIHPGETFSFWKTVGSTTRRKGYKDGRVIMQNRITAGEGGGLCNLGNTIHLLVLYSPLQVTEIHYHSDALAPDEGERVPFRSGTSVCYNHIDFRFLNTTDQDVQLVLWVENQTLYAELRSQQPFPWCYELEEEGHHFRQENGKYYRVSKIYRHVFDRDTGADLNKELVWDNHSEVMFDYDLIPRDQIRV